MNTIKIPEGWYEITGQPTRKSGDMFYWTNDFALSPPKWEPILGRKDKQEIGFRYIRRMDCNHLEAERARLAKYRPHYQKSVAAKETAKDGILAAAEAIRYNWAESIGHLQAGDIATFIGLHCVGKEEYLKALDSANSEYRRGRGYYETEKARADNLQAELAKADQQLKFTNQQLDAIRAILYPPHYYYGQVIRRHD